jgi:predicted DNA-binding protein with PD1-like motif
MQNKLVATESGRRTWVLILSSGEEVRKTILQFASGNGVMAASFVALGAFECAELAYFDWQAKKYQPIRVEEQVEVISLVGDIAENEKGEPDLHAHAVLGRFDGSTRGGHLQEAIVRPTLELTLTETPAHLKRRMHKDIHVALIDIAG